MAVGVRSELPESSALRQSSRPARAAFLDSQVRNYSASSLRFAHGGNRVREGVLPRQLMHYSCCSIPLMRQVRPFETSERTRYRPRPPKPACLFQTIRNSA